MEQSANVGSVGRAMDRLTLEGQRLFVDFELWLSRLGDLEKLLGLCLFTLVLLLLIMRRPRNYKEGGGMGRQFVLALAIVAIFSFGVGWMFEGELNLPSWF